MSTVVKNVYSTTGLGTGDSTHGQNTINHYYNKAGIKAATEINVYGQWADKQYMPTKMGKEFKISKFLHIYDRELTDGEFGSKGYLTARSIDDVTNSLSVADPAYTGTDPGTGAGLPEGSGPRNKRVIKKITMNCSFSRYGEMIDYTDEVDLFSEDHIQVRYREELGRLANRRSEDLIQIDMLSTSNVMLSGLAATTKEVKDRINYDLIRRASRKLVRNRAEKNTSIVTGSTKVDTRTINKAFYAIIGPEIKFDLDNLTRGVDHEKEYIYIPAYKYAAAANLAEGEVGAMGDVRFIESESALVYRGKGAAFVPISDLNLVNATGEATTADGTLSATTYSIADAIATVGHVMVYNPTAAAITIPPGTVAGNPYGGSLGAYTTIKVIVAADAIALGAIPDIEVSSTFIDVFPILFPTKGSFATVGLKGHDKIKFNSQSPSVTELGNPYGTMGFFSYNMWYAGIILQEERLLKVLVAASE